MPPLRDLRGTIARALAVAAAMMLPVLSWAAVSRVVDARAMLVQSVDVSTLQGVDTHAVLVAARLDAPRSILSVSADGVERALADYPWLDDVDATVNYRARTVTITGHVREAAAIALADGAWVISERGDVIGPWQGDDRGTLPTLVGVAVPGRDDATTRDAFRALLDRIAEVEASPLATEHGAVREAHARGVAGTVLVFADGLELRLGRDRVRERIALAVRAWEALGAERSSVLYVLADGRDLSRVTFGTSAPLTPPPTP